MLERLAHNERVEGSNPTWPISVLIIKTMIQMNTILNVADNSGARKVRCFRVLGGYRKNTAQVGDIIMASVQSMRKKIKGQSTKLNKGDVVRCLVVRTKKLNSRKTGLFYKSSENAVVLINNQGKPLGTRVFGPISEELRKVGFNRVLNLGQTAPF